MVVGLLHELLKGWGFCFFIMRSLRFQSVYSKCGSFLRRAGVGDVYFIIYCFPRNILGRDRR